MEAVKLKKQMTALDVTAMARELRQLIVGSFVDNVYQAWDGSVILKLRRAGEQLTLIGDVMGRVGLTWADYAKPSRPPAFASLLRSRIRGGRVAGVEQVNMDRILALDVLGAGSTWRLVFELVRGFNAILLREDVILGCLHPRKMRDRALMPRERYLPPPWRGVNPFTSNPASLLEELRKQRGKLAASIVKAFNVSGEEAEEACLQAGLDKDKPVTELSEADVGRLRECLLELRRRALEGELRPHIVLRGGQPFTVLPFELTSIEGERRYFNSFNQAIDHYFTWLRARVEEEKRLEELKEREKRLKEALRQQRERLEELQRRASELRTKAEAIMANLPLAQQAIDVLVEELGKGARGEELLKRVRSRVPEVVEIDLASKKLYIQLGGVVVPLDYSTTAAQSASMLYEEAKEAERRAKRVEDVMKVAAQQDLVRRGRVEQATPSFRRRAWYERFRWFYTSNGYLVLGGRDSSQNERLIRRYLEEGDVFVHADIHGAPAVVIKRGREAGEEDLKEAAQFAVSYSRAWREGRLQGDAYWVFPSQVSKTPPPGEYLPRGGFMIRGERNYVRGLPLEVAIGIDEEGKVIGGPPISIARRAKRYVVLAPGQDPASKVAKEVISRLGLPSSEVEEVVRFMPPGSSRIIKVVGGPE